MARKSGTRLVNVRLGADDAALVAALRQDGVELSSLVRDAIRQEYGRRRRRLRAGDVDALLAAIYARHPDPETSFASGPDVHDRRAFAEAVGRRVRSEAGQ
jgi:hypothetical protein